MHWWSGSAAADDNNAGLLVRGACQRRLLTRKRLTANVSGKVGICRSHATINLSRKSAQAAAAMWVGMWVESE